MPVRGQAGGALRLGRAGPPLHQQKGLHGLPEEGQREKLAGALRGIHGQPRRGDPLHRALLQKGLPERVQDHPHRGGVHHLQTQGLQEPGLLWKAHRAGDDPPLPRLFPPPAAARPAPRLQGCTVLRRVRGEDQGGHEPALQRPCARRGPTGGRRGCRSLRNARKPQALRNL